MAAKRKGKKRRTAAQRAATKRLVAFNKSKRGGKRKKRRKGKRKSVGAHYRSHLKGPSYPQHSSVASHYHSGTRSYAAGIAAHRPKRRKKRRKTARVKWHRDRTQSVTIRKATRRAKKSGVVTAASILRNAKSNSMKIWLCGGKTRTGCGGGVKGRKGSRVVGYLR